MTFGDGSDVTLVSLPESYINTGAGDDTVVSVAPRVLAYLGEGDDVVSLKKGGSAYGGGGHDVVVADASSIVDAGEGNDWVYGSPQTDLIFGDDGNDVLKGGGGDDSIFGGDGVDSLLGGDGNDELTSGPGVNLTLAGRGDDRIISTGERSVVFAGPGNDIFHLGSGWHLATGGLGNDVYVLEQGCDIDADSIIIGGAGYDKVVSPYSGDELAARGIALISIEEVEVDPDLEAGCGRRESLTAHLDVDEQSEILGELLLAEPRDGLLIEAKRAAMAEGDLQAYDEEFGIGSPNNTERLDLNKPASPPGDPLDPAESVDPGEVPPNPNDLPLRYSCCENVPMEPSRCGDLDTPIVGLLKRGQPVLVHRVVDPDDAVNTSTPQILFQLRLGWDPNTVVADVETASGLRGFVPLASLFEGPVASTEADLLYELPYREFARSIYDQIAASMPDGIDRIDVFGDPDGGTYYDCLTQTRFSCNVGVDGIPDVQCGTDQVTCDRVENACLTCARRDTTCVNGIRDCVNIGAGSNCDDPSLNNGSEEQCIRDACDGILSEEECGYDVPESVECFGYIPPGEDRRYVSPSDNGLAVGEYPIGSRSFSGCGYNQSSLDPKFLRKEYLTKKMSVNTPSLAEADPFFIYVEGLSGQTPQGVPIDYYLAGEAGVVTAALPVPPDSRSFDERNFTLSFLPEGDSLELTVCFSGPGITAPIDGPGQIELFSRIRPWIRKLKLGTLKTSKLSGCLSGDVVFVDATELRLREEDQGSPQADRDAATRTLDRCFGNSRPDGLRPCIKWDDRLGNVSLGNAVLKNLDVTLTIAGATDFAGFATALIIRSILFDDSTVGEVVGLLAGKSTSVALSNGVTSFLETKLGKEVAKVVGSSLRSASRSIGRDPDFAVGALFAEACDSLQDSLDPDDQESYLRAYVGWQCQLAARRPALRFVAGESSKAKNCYGSFRRIFPGDAEGDSGRAWAGVGGESWYFDGQQAPQGMVDEDAGCRVSIDVDAFVDPRNERFFRCAFAVANDWSNLGESMSLEALLEERCADEYADAFNSLYTATDLQGMIDSERGVSPEQCIGQNP